VWGGGSGEKIDFLFCNLVYNRFFNKRVILGDLKPKFHVNVKNGLPPQWNPNFSLVMSFVLKALLFHMKYGL